ncbi:class I SAM-dependent methyltransferase [Nocardia otitidiscaviarum]|uniref:class I SAM-dependent methyltransferase n=1 Tax=Nocardia otitidiscaviarum TaxID=1823 RepID=UPI001896032C|nr:class I SAM-dependent methyltransferase [Nocardia otitidiscaviarum]MBF6180737.1 class I SAM-dependent methyltransferase [Nocardia otitidiscaviarum]
MNEPPADRQPTSHERRSGLSWDESYRDEPAPWDTGRPQPAIVRLAAAGAFGRTVLDAGCGTGENTLHIAAAGAAVLGVDVAETAIAMARRKATARGLDAEFAVADAFRLHLHRTFDSIVDSGLFHTFDADERTAYAHSLTSVTTPGSRLFILCFGDNGPDPGPHPVSREALTAPFDDPAWQVADIAPEIIETRFAPDGAPAWLATVERLAG